MKKTFFFLLINLILIPNLKAGSLQEDWAKDIEIYQAGVRQCADVYAQKSGSFNSEHYRECVDEFNRLNNARIEARELARKNRCDSMRQKIESTRNYSAGSDVGNFLMGMLNSYMEDEACGYQRDLI